MSMKIPDILTPEEQAQLLSSGLRLSEMTSLKWKDINLMTGQLKVVEGKGAKDRILWVDDTTIQELRSWKERQFKDWGSTEYIFTTRTLNLLDGKAVRKMIKTYTEKAGINKDITTHSLRHTFATDLLRDTKNIRTVQKALGHSDIGTTQIYTHIVDEELEKAMKTFRS